MIRGENGCRIRWAVGALLGLCLVSSPVFATHEADHRFVVYGTVYNDHGRPVRDAKVFVVDTRIDQGTTAFTDRQGKYEALLHLHNSDLGDEIVVTALGERKSVRAEFDPEDRTAARKARVDFGIAGEKPSGSPNLKGGIVLGLALIAVVAVLVIFLVRSRKGSSSKKGRKKRR